jgi:hypothetical protein
MYAAGKIPTEMPDAEDWIPFLFVVVVVAYGFYRVTRHGQLREHDNWVRLGRALDGRADVTVRLQGAMPLQEVQRIGWMMGYQHVSSESARWGYVRHRLLRRPGSPNIARNAPKGWWQ